MDALLSIWVAVLGLTRVNLLGESTDFLLSPFLLLSPLVIGVGAMATLARGGRVSLPRGLGRFVQLIAALLAAILVSAFLSEDLATSARRTLLLFVQISAVVLGGVFLVNRPDPRRVVLKGACIGLAISILLNILQVGDWFNYNWLPDFLTSMVSSEPGNYGGVVPRLTGASHDPNHGGVLILGYCFLIWRFGGREGRWRSLLLWVGGVSIVLTLSRSAMLAALVVCLIARYPLPGLAVSRRAGLRLAGAVAGVSIALLAFPAATELLGEGWGILGSRFTIGEGSSQVHASVLGRGWEVGTRDLKHMLFGIGYGNAFTALQDIFPGSKYGNFHSFFMTLFAESGIFAAVIGAVLFIRPLARGGPHRPMIAALLVFNLFQQAQTEPISWFLLFLAWTDFGRPARRPLVGAAVEGVRAMDRPVAMARNAEIEFRPS